MTNKEKLIPPHGGYRKLKSFQLASLAHDLTVEFCERFVDNRNRSDRTDQADRSYRSYFWNRQADQMIQAGRSGVQNIAEGSRASGTSKKTELKLIGVARASLEELLLDFEDFLRQRKMRLWKKDDASALEARSFLKNLDLSDRPDQSDPSKFLSEETLSDSERFANLMLCLIHQSNFLLDQQLRTLEKSFLEEGGFTERLYRFRKGIICLISLISLIGLIPKTASAAITLRPPLGLGLVGYWSMDEGVGSEAGDMSGNGHDGSIISAATDDFNRADGSLGEPWTMLGAGGASNPLVISGNQAHWTNGTADALAQYQSDVTDVYGQFKIVAMGDGTSQAILLRSAISANFPWDGRPQGYFLKIEDRPGFPTYRWAIGHASGTYTNWTEVAGGDWGSVAMGDTVKLEVIGDTITGYVNGAEVGSFTDSTFASGGIGLTSYYANSSNYVDDWEVGIAGDIWTNGKRGKALDFNGTSDVMTIGNVGSGIKTVSFWINADDLTSRKVIDFDGTDQIEIDGSGNILATSFPGTTVIYIDGSVSSALTAGWHHVVVTDTTGVNGSAMNIGKVGSGYFDGKLDEVRVYNRALSGTEVASIYNSGAAQFLMANNAGLVGSWSFEEGTGTKAGDSSGNGLTTNTFSGSPTWADGKKGNALQFSGNGTDYATVANDSDINFGASQDFTVAAWVKSNATQVSGRYPGIIAKEDGVTTRQGYGFTLYASVDYAQWYFYIFSGGAQYQAWGASSIRDGNWHFIVGVRSGDRILAYQDGVLTHDAAGTAGSVSKNTSLYIGRMQANPHYDAMTIDEVRVYNRALAPSEVEGLYASSGKGTEINSSQNSRLTNGLVGMWSFDGPDVNMSTNTAYDRSGSGNNGTITGATQAIGKVGQALSFSGGAQYVNAGQAASLDIANAETISFWIKGNAPQLNSYGPIISKLGTYGWLVQTNETGPNIYLRIDTSGGTNQSAGNISTLDGTWHHIAWTLDNGARKGYKDGVLIVDNAYNHGSGFGAATTDLIIDNPNSVGFNGSIDEVRVYNRALSVGEIQQLYNMGR